MTMPPNYRIKPTGRPVTSNDHDPQLSSRRSSHGVMIIAVLFAMALFTSATILAEGIWSDVTELQRNARRAHRSSYLYERHAAEGAFGMIEGHPSTRHSAPASVAANGRSVSTSLP